MRFSGLFVPKTVQEAIEAFERANGAAFYVNGGTDVLVVAREKDRFDGKLAIDLPSIAEKKAYIVQQLTQETWETELRIEMPHKHYVNMTPAVAECRAKMYADLHGGKV